MAKKVTQSINPLDALKGLSSKQEEKKSSKKDKKEIFVEGEIADAVDEFSEAKKIIDEQEGILKARRPVISSYCMEIMLEKLVNGDRESIKLRTNGGNDCTFMLKDQYTKTVFEDMEHKKQFYADLKSAVGDPEEFIEEGATFFLKEEAVKNESIMKELVAFAQKIKEKHDIELLDYKEHVNVKKGSVDKIATKVKTKEKLELAIALLKPQQAIK